MVAFWDWQISLQQLFQWDDYSQDNEYIIFEGIMFDLYQAIVPAISIIIFLNLLSLKLSLRDNVTLSKIYKKKESLHLKNQQNQVQEESVTKTLLKYMLINFTPIEFFAVRRARYKLVFLLATSITLLASYFIESPFFLAPVGIAFCLTYFFVAVFTYKSGNQQSQPQLRNQKQKYMQIILSVVTIVINMVLFRVLFKNYQNSLLSTFILNASINLALDNFLVKPVLLILVGLPLSRSTKVVEYVVQCNRNQRLLQIYDQIGQKQMLVKPGKMFSPSKVASRIPLNYQIQPVPYNQQNLKRRQEQGMSNPMDLLKKIKKEKLLPPININLQSNLEAELSLNSLFNSTKKQQDSHVQEPLQEPKFQTKLQMEQGNFQLPIKKNFCSQNLIMVNPSRPQQAENEEAIVSEEIIKEKASEQCIRSARYPQEANDLKKTLQQNNVQEEQQPAKISGNSSQQVTSRQQPLRISLNGQINLNMPEDQNEDEYIESDNYRKRKELHTVDQSCNKHSFGVLQIKEQNHGYHPSQQLEEIDLNSPQKKKKHQLQIQPEDDSKIGVLKRKKKKFSHDHNNRVIKFSTGQPYLQYLPHMLGKDSKGKKSQAISKKDVIIDSRATNTVKKPKKRLVSLENNENIVPEFRIQDL